MLGTAGTFASIGYFALFVLGAFLSWRTVAMICIVVPICMFSAMIFVRIYCVSLKIDLKMYLKMLTGPRDANLVAIERSK